MQLNRLQISEIQLIRPPQPNIHQPIIYGRDGEILILQEPEPRINIQPVPNRPNINPPGHVVRSNWGSGLFDCCGDFEIFLATILVSLILNSIYLINSIVSVFYIWKKCK